MVSSPVEEIKNRLDVVEIVGSYVKLQKTGANFRGACPFHSEKKPSFFVSPSRQIWHCFGCSLGGDIFRFIMQIEGLEFGDALRLLAQKAGVELKKESPQLKTQRQRLYEICEIACQFFEKQLKESAVGKAVKDYLLKRGINEESVKKWRLGYGPDNWRALSDFLVGKGYQREEIINAGLAVESEKSKNPYDRFRGRIIFPIFDLNSQVIGFGGRITENKEETAKYINTPQTLLYDKSRVLYGLHSAKMEIRKNKACILVEGYTDAILAHQAGTENTVATSGTALTPYQLKILKRYSENIITAFDMDVAGDSATKRGINLAQEMGFEIKIAKFPKGADPADIIFKSPKDWQKIINSARSILDFYFDSAFSGFNKDTPEGKREIAKIILPILKRIQNKIEQSHWVQELARKLKVEQEAVLEELKKINPSEIGKKEEIDQTFQVFPKGFEGRQKILEERIISLVLKNPENLMLIDKNRLGFFSGKSRQILKILEQNKEEKNAQIVLKNLEGQTSSEFQSNEFKNFLSVLSLRAEVDYIEDPEEEIQLCLSGLKSIGIKNELKKITEDLKRAEEDKNENLINNLMEKFNKLAKEV